jgi:maltooligosyltrehalose trehalohydrolase
VNERTEQRSPRRRFPIGAEILPSGGVSFRAWAPKRQRVAVEIADKCFMLERSGKGYFEASVESAKAGDLYRFRLDDAGSFPDPASRYQPEGPHGPSMIVDPTRFQWSDSKWPGVGTHGNVMYELHIGTFTREGTFAAAAKELPALAELGVTIIELLPLAEFAGRYGWGYDGVNLFAPFHHYGSCDDLRAFIDRAHSHKLGVILDVVYNHFGPDGNYIGEFGPFESAKHVTEWGTAVNFDGDDAGGVREFVTTNARYWIDEYHFDGLRIDATQDIHDASDRHIIADVGAAAREAGGRRSVILIAENEPQDSRLVRSIDDGGYALDAMWCDDFHHTAIVAATGKREAYYTDYSGEARELVATLKRGPLYQGQRYSWQKNRRGFAAWDVPAHSCVVFLENHDQVANTIDGRRLHERTSPGIYRALTAVTLLAPQTPMLFQGQEFASSAPFFYFADQRDEIRDVIRNGRAKFLHQFRSIRPFGVADLVDPCDPGTFERSRLDQRERELHRESVALHRDLIALRRNDRVLAADGVTVDGAVLGDHVFVLRYFGPKGSDRLLVVNLSTDFTPTSLAEPLLAATGRGHGWRLVWSSEGRRYGGCGAVSPEAPDGSWLLQGESAALLADDGVGA